MDNVFNDWKAPLQYWIGSVFMPISEDPVAAGRTASVIFSILGLIGVYYGVKHLYDEKTAIIAGITFALIPASLYVGIRYMADIFVLSSAALLLYGFIKILTTSKEKIPWSDIGVALLAGTMLLLSKQSGVLYFYVFIFLPFFFFFEARKEWRKKKEGEELSKKERNNYRENKKAWYRNVGIFAGVWVFSFLFYKMILPARIFARDIYTGQWTFSIKELLGFPFDIWKENFNIVYEVFAHYYGLPAVIALVGFFVFALWKKNWRDIAIGFLFILSSCGVIFGLKWFNEHIYISLTLIFAVYMIARFAVVSFSLNERWIRGCGVIIIIAMILWSGYQIIIMKSAPMKYLEWGTGQMKQDLLNWTNGWNIREAVNMLKTIPGPSVLFVDPQWGNPGTALSVYRNQFPQVQVYPISSDLFKPEVQAEITKLGFKNKMAIYSKTGNAQDSRNMWQIPLEQTICRPENRKEITSYENQTPLIFCEWQ